MPRLLLLLLLLSIIPISAPVFGEGKNDLLKTVGSKYGAITPYKISAEVDLTAAHNSESSINTLYHSYSNEIDTTRYTANGAFLFGLSEKVVCHFSVPVISVQEESSYSSDKKETGIGDITAGIAIHRPIEEGLIVFDLLYTSPTGSSPFEIDINEELATGDGFHTLSPEVGIFRHLDQISIYGIAGLKYSFPLSGIDQRRSGPNGETVLNKVTPGLVYGFSLGNLLSLSETTTVGLGFRLHNESETTYEWHHGTESKSKSETFSYFYLNGRFNVGSYAVYPELSIGLSDASEDFKLSFRLPVF